MVFFLRKQYHLGGVVSAMKARDMLQDLLDNYDLDETYKAAVIDNLKRLTKDNNVGLPKLNWYNKKDHKKS